ncbi:MAG: hypothetical protein OEY18_11045 [Candidatus Aminicenantes bacterium]|nr:hypothetical protein [Candidatus Aminicenantes bacterium]
MKIRKKEIFIALMVFLAFPGSSNSHQEQCTSAVVSVHASSEGTPILWKNRDTGVLSNKVVFVKDKPFSYLALVNASTPSGRQAFAGLNSTGFAIMNTVAYNLPKKSGEMEDLEGIIMADALRICRSVQDFEDYIKANLGPDMGSWANYGVIDSLGNAYIFEIHNHGYNKIDASSAPEKYLINTNYSRSGAVGKGAGYLRFERASQLFLGLKGEAIDFQAILSHFTRDIGHVLLKHPAIDDLKKIPSSENAWIFTRDCINRPSTSAAVVITGKTPPQPESLATMWVIPGEPLCAIALPLWVEAGTCPEKLWLGEHAAMWQESLRIKNIIRPFTEGNKGDYINLTRLDNSEKTGFLHIILQVEKEIIEMTRAFLKARHTPDELAAFQEEMAEKAFLALESIH